MQGEPRLGLREQQPARQSNKALVNAEKGDRQGETRSGMFRVEARADRGSEIADHGFRDAIEAEGDGRSAQAVLQNADGHAQKQTRRRIAPAQPEIDDDEKRKIKNRRLRKKI